MVAHRRHYIVSAEHADQSRTVKHEYAVVLPFDHVARGNVKFVRQ